MHPQDRGVKIIDAAFAAAVLPLPTLPSASFLFHILVHLLPVTGALIPLSAAARAAAAGAWPVCVLHLDNRYLLLLAGLCSARGSMGPCGSDAFLGRRVLAVVVRLDELPVLPVLPSLVICCALLLLLRVVRDAALGFPLLVCVTGVVLLWQAVLALVTLQGREGKVREVRVRNLRVLVTFAMQ